MAAPDAGPIVERHGAPLPGLVPPHEREASIPLPGNNPAMVLATVAAVPGLPLPAVDRGTHPAIPPSPAPAIRFTS